MKKGIYKNILLTGGAGFIGSHLVRLLVNKYEDSHVYNLDILSYAGNLANLRDIEDRKNYSFVKADICDFNFIKSFIEEKKIDAIIHLAAESHVDRSIREPFKFAQTNIMGTLSLLEAARLCWSKSNYENKCFYHVSTDEVYGSLSLDEQEKSYFTENTKYDPHSPYSASKASGDHFVRAYHDTYGLPILISNCSNNYGPYQFPEKLIPLLINNILNRRSLPIYGKGENIRDWLYVEDHARAIDLILHEARDGQTYNIGAGNEWRNIDLVKLLISLVDEALGRAEGEDLGLISFVKDRQGHDLRYAIDSKKLREELLWQPSLDFKQGLKRTVEWYLENQSWLENVSSGEYMAYYEKMYKDR